MMQTGTEVRIKDKATGEKIHGVVTSVSRETEMLDVTVGPNDFGILADPYRKFAPGRTRTTIIIEVTG